MLPILYRDEHLIAIHKPAHLLVHRSELDRHETRFAVQLLRDQIGQHVQPAHRLDKGTSGALLFALNPDCARELGRQFELQQVDKTYLAIVRGYTEDSGIVDYPLGPCKDERASLRADAPAKAALTRYRTLARVELPIEVEGYPTSRYSLVELHPETGRRHQLRRHLKHIAHPIIGDATYGRGRHNRMFAERLDSHRLLLACTAMSLTHPVSGERLDIRCPLAEDFAATLRALGWEELID